MVKLLYPELSYKLVGVLFKVYNQLGPALHEKYYQRAIEEELKSQKIGYQREVAADLTYNEKIIGKYIIDFVIEDSIILEVKSVKFVHPRFLKQILCYLDSTNLRLGILANFGKSQFEYKRIVK